MELFKYILNKKQETIFFTGLVSSLSPLSVKIYTDDAAILCKSLTHLLGLKVGSNVLLIKIGSQFIVVGVIGAVP
jgi:hypothetical protein